MSKPSIGKIANRVRRGRGSVAWYMMTHGLIEKPIGARAKGGYTAEHDDRITQLSLIGLKNAEIDRIITEEFGIRRDSHSVRCRLARLAIVPDAEDLAEAA